MAWQYVDLRSGRCSRRFWSGLAFSRASTAQARHAHRRARLARRRDRRLFRVVGLAQNPSAALAAACARGRALRPDRLFHGISKLGDLESFALYNAAIANSLENLFPAHLHANNFARFAIVASAPIPVEVTFVTRKSYSPASRQNVGPMAVDAPNNGTAGVLVSGTHGIIINGASVVVQLRGLDIFAVGNSLNGIHFIQGNALHVSNCTIRNFIGNNSFGISFAPNGPATLARL
jgi:hypothetical protein